MSKKTEPIEMKWEFLRESVSDKPEDHGRAVVTVPFDYRLRFAVNPQTDREPIITLYIDFWQNEHRNWVQNSAKSYSLSFLKRLMVLLDEELKK